MNAEQLEHDNLKQEWEEIATQELYANIDPAKLHPPSSSTVQQAARPQMQWPLDDGDDHFMDREDDSFGFQGMWEIITVDQEEERQARELEDFGKYMEQLLLPHEPNLEEDDTTVPCAVAGLEDLGMYNLYNIYALCFDPCCLQQT
jgi:hypothetical protein